MMDIRGNKKIIFGFTLIELLVVVAIIGLLLSMVMLNLSNSRMKSRDAKRLSDINQIRSGLELYYTHGHGYPSGSGWVPGANLACDDNFIMRVPDDILSGFSYAYTEGGTSSSGCGEVVWSAYQLRFTMEMDSHLGPPGNYYLYPGGISSIPVL